jgi:hypothetical protein
MDWSVFGYRTLAASDLAEAASRQGDTEALAAVTDWTTARAAATPTDWALGISALVGALAADEPDAADVLSAPQSNVWIGHDCDSRWRGLSCCTTSGCDPEADKPMRSSG